MGVYDTPSSQFGTVDQAAFNKLLSAPVEPYRPPPAPITETGVIPGTVKALGRGIAGIGGQAGQAMEWNADYQDTIAPGQTTGDESKLSIVNKLGKSLKESSEKVKDYIGEPQAEDFAKKSWFSGVESLPASLAYAVPSFVGASLGAGLGVVDSGGITSIPQALAGAAIGQSIAAPIMYRSAAQEHADTLRKLDPNIDNKKLMDAAVKAGHAEWMGETISDLPEAVIFSRLPGFKGVIKSVRQGIKPTVKQFGKNMLATQAAEQLGEGYTTVQQIGALNDALPSDKQIPLKQALIDTAGSTAVMSGLMGIGGTGVQYARGHQIEKLLANPAADPEKRGEAAGKVYAVLKEAEKEGTAPQQSADNFLQHALDAIGAEKTTGTAPYALNLGNAELLQPFQAAKQGQAADDIPDFTPPPAANIAGTSILADSNPQPVPQAAKPAGAMTNALEAGGIAIPPALTAPTTADMYSSFAAAPFANAPEAQPIAAPLPAAPDAATQELNRAIEWRNSVVNQGNGHLLNGLNKPSYPAYIIGEYRKAQASPQQEKTNAITDLLPDMQDQGALQVGRTPVDLPEVRRQAEGNGSDNRQSGGITDGLSRLQQEVHGAQEALPPVRQSVEKSPAAGGVEVKIARLQQEKETLLADPKSRGIAGVLYTDEVTRRVNEINREMQQLAKVDEYQKVAAVTPGGSPTPLDALAHEAATSPANNHPEPTQAQIEAGNYRKGHVNVSGMDISIENPAGSMRKGVDADGKAWETKLAHHYGYIKGTVGRDKDHVDVFIGPDQGSDKVYVVDQIDPKTGKLDEHKVMLSFDSLPAARKGYLANYDKSGSKRIGAITESSVDDFKQWLKNGNTKKAFAPVTQVTKVTPVTNPRRQLDTTKDALPVAIAKLGGISHGEVLKQVGVAAGKDLARTLNLAASKSGSGYLHVISTKGMPLDKMREALVEQGYLKPSDDINTLLDKLDSAQRGTVHRSTHSADAGTDAYNEAERRYAEMIGAMDEEEYAEFSKNQWLDEQAADLAEAADIIDEYLAGFDEANMTAADWQEVENDLKEALDAEVIAGSVEKDQGPLQEDAAGQAAGVHEGGEGDTEVEGKTDAGKGGVRSTALPNATAPEHVQTGVTDKELNQIVAEFNSAQQSALDGEEAVTHIFDAPKKGDVVRLQDKAKVYSSKHGWMTPAEAKVKISEWKNHAKEQGKTGANRDKVVLSLFDLSGEWSRPWEEAGYQVFRFDIQDDPTIGDVHNFSGEFFSDWFGDFDGMDIHAILAATPCTEFAVSGARHFAAKDADGRTVSSVKLVHQTLATIEHFKPAVWAIENPVGRIEKLGGLPPWRLSFDPNHVGDPYTKKTLLWGRFNGDLPVAPVEPTEGSKMHKLYGGKSQATKNARSVTPEGFSYAFFMANNAVDHPVMAVANKFDRLDRDLIAKAIDAGMTEQDITGVVEEFYYQEMDDEGAETALSDAIKDRNSDTMSNDIVSPETTSSTSEKTKIEDFGEKIGGARKDYAAKFDHAKTLDIATEPFAKTWPEPDYLKMLADGFDEQHVSLVRALRDEIPDKPRKSWKLKPWVELVKSLRGHAELALQGKSPTLYNVLKNTQFENSAAQNIAGRAELYHAVGHDVSLRGVTIKKNFYNLFNGEKNVTKWQIEKPQKATVFGNMPHELGVGNTKAEAIEDFKTKLEALDQEGKGKAPTQFVIYQYRAKNKPGYFIGKKVGKDYLNLQKFDDAKAAREYRDSHQAELEAQLAAMKKVPNERRATNNPRTGKDYRGGKDVTPEMFTQSFGFRGVEFGNYVEGAKRQTDLNNAFDALNDLAGLLNIPTRAISLDGELGLAFGARGHGGKNAAAAHYEADRVVINLTKNQGAGSLAHEWFHALDSYLSRKRGYRDEFITNKTVKYGPQDETRQELIDAFKELKKTLDATNLRTRSRELDKTRSKDYWSTGIEMHARAFENYIIDRLTDSGFSNDYLANINSVSEYAEALLNGFMNGQSVNDLYPYLLDAEKADVVKAFEKLFATVKTKETPRGVTLYSNPLFDPKAIIESLSGLKENLQQDLPKLVRLGQQVIHEGAGKYQQFVAGIKKYLGEKWDTFKHLMLKVYHQAKEAYGKSSDADKSANFALAVKDVDDILKAKGENYGTGQGDNQRQLSASAIEGIRRSLQALHDHLGSGPAAVQGRAEGSDTGRGKRQQQDQLARQWATRNNLPILSEDQFNRSWEESGKIKGGENRVYIDQDPNGSFWAIKMNDLGYHKGDMQALVDRLQISSQYFPDTTNEVVGMVETPQGVKPILKQPFVERAADALAPRAGIAKALKEYGFTLLDPDADLWLSPDQNYYVTDMGRSNVLLDRFGNFRFIDAIFQRTSAAEIAKDFPKLKLPDIANMAMDGKTSAGTTAVEAQSWVTTLPIAKRVNVVQSPDDLPAAARNEITKAKVNPAWVQAMELHGTIHVITGNIPTMQRVKALVIGHELAHAGQTERILNWSVDWFKRTEDGKTDAAKEAHELLSRTAERYGYDLADEAQYRRAVKETTAIIAERAATEGWKPTGLIQRLFMHIKYWLRQRGLVSTVSDSELSLAVAEMLRIGEKRLSVGKGGNEPQFAAAWHGSPADFDRFSTENIGEGEGAQAYGYGLYFAGSKDVADYYREALSRGAALSMGELKNYFQPGRIVPSYGGQDKVVSFNHNDNHGWSVTVHHVDKDGNRPIGPDGRNRTHFTMPSDKEYEKVTGEKPVRGKLYHVDLAPKEDEYLLWDKPLSEQSEKVKGVIEEAYKEAQREQVSYSKRFPDAGLSDYEYRMWVDKVAMLSIMYDGIKGETYRTGSDMYHAFSRVEGGDQVASDILHSLGIRGIKYLDGSSRSQGEGNYNYVIFNDADVEIKAKFALADQQIATHASAIKAPAKVTDMVKSLFELAGQSIPPRLKANIGKILSNPWFGSEGKPIRRHVVNLNLERSQNRNSIMSDLFQKSEGYSGVEGLDNILKKASKEELKQFNALIKYGDRNDVGQTFTRDELYRGKTPFGKVGRTVVEAYKAFQEIMQAANRVRFEQLDELSMLPYKDQEWFASLVDLLNKNQQRAAGLDAKEAGEFHRLIRSLKRNLTDDELSSGENPAKVKASPAVIAAYRDFWKQVEAVDKKHQGNMLSAFRDVLGYRDELDKLKNDWGNLRGYAPRNRKDGDWHVSVYRVNDEGERVKVYMKPTLTETGAKGQVEKVRADLKNHLKSNFDPAAKYEVEYERNSATPSELLAWKGSEVAVEALLNKAFDSAGVTGKMSVEQWQSLKHEVFQQIAKEIIAQGFGRHGISREATLIEGYDDSDYQTVIKEYISGMAGWLSKMRFAIETTAAAKDLSKAAPEDKVWVNDYVQDAMKNSTYMDELAATARSIGAVYYLGFKVSSAILNAFQNYTVGQAELSLMMKKGGLKGSAIAALATAQKDVMKDWANLNRGGKGILSEEEHDVLNRAVREGTTQAQAIRQISGSQEMGFGTAWKGFVEKSMTPFQFVEQRLNREPAILAAYRLFRKGPAGTFDEAAYLRAEEFVNNTHYVMGKENLPEIVRKLGPLGKTVYLFQGYVHNYLHWMYNRAKDGEFATIARSLGAIAALGGVFALPGADDLDKWIMKWYGVSYKMKFKKFVRDNAGNSAPGQLVQDFVNHGVTSVAGVDMSRALAVNLPFVSDPDKSFGERIGGAWGGLAKKPGMALSAAQKGDYLRAVENLMPEFAANPMRAVRQYNQGATTMSGKPIFDETGRQVKYGAGDVVKKMLGFNPLEVSERTEMKGDERELNAYWKGEREDLLANIRRAKTRDDFNAVTRDVTTFNRRLRQSQAFGLVPIIKADTIRRAREAKPQKKTLMWERNQLD